MVGGVAFVVKELQARFGSWADGIGHANVNGRGSNDWLRWETNDSRDGC